MAYDEGVAEHAREAMEHTGFEITEKKMFGGLCFLLNGNMLCGVIGEEMMFRVGKDQYEECLSKENAREMDFTGRQMKGMIYINSDGVSNEIDEWLTYALNFVAELPPK